jgi:uncharacterized UBP type Zn finger protein
MKMKSCDHLDNWIELISPSAYACKECKKTDSKWVHLRCCQSCGAVLCCDSSPNQHASKHAAESGHPIIISAESQEKWAWCYTDELIKRY